MFEGFLSESGHGEPPRKAEASQKSHLPRCPSELSPSPDQRPESTDQLSDNSRLPTIHMDAVWGATSQAGLSADRASALA